MAPTTRARKYVAPKVPKERKESSTRARKNVAPKVYKERKEPYSVLKRVKSRTVAPVEISLFHLKKILGKTRNKSSKMKIEKEHEMVQDYGNVGFVALQECVEPSVNQIMHDLSPKATYCQNSNFLLREIRKIILNHNWIGGLDMFRELLNYSGISRRYLIYIFRLLFILQFNMRVAPKQLDRFLAFALGFNNEKLKSKFLKSLFELPIQLKLGRRLELRRQGRPREFDEFLLDDDLQCEWTESE